LVVWVDSKCSVDRSALGRGTFHSGRRKEGCHARLVLSVRFFLYGILDYSIGKLVVEVDG
jgi:hypothetical protein